MAFDIDGARKAGYSDGEIAEYLGKENSFDTASAIKSGYEPLEIINHLTLPKGNAGRGTVNPEAVAVAPDSPAGAGRGSSEDPRRFDNEPGLLDRIGDSMNSVRDYMTDAKPQPKPAGAGRGFVNPSQPDRERSFTDAAGDIGITAMKGAIALPQSAAGLVDIVTLGKAGKTLESLGYNPAQAQQILDELYSPAQQQANDRLQGADGLTDTIKTAIENPSTVAASVLESIPQMLGGAGIARGMIKASAKVSPAVAGALGEGALGAGSSASDIRSQTSDGELTLKQAASALGSGAGTAAFGYGGSKFAGRLGLGDVDTMLATGKLGVSKEGFFKSVIGSGISEGAFEEMPQSAQEQMWKNFATDKPLMDGVGNAAGMGLVTGSAMGGAGGVSSHVNGKIQDRPSSVNGIIAKAMDAATEGASFDPDAMREQVINSMRPGQPPQQVSLGERTNPEPAPYAQTSTAPYEAAPAVTNVIPGTVDSVSTILSATTVDESIAQAMTAVTSPVNQAHADLESALADLADLKNMGQPAPVAQAEAVPNLEAVPNSVSVPELGQLDKVAGTMDQAAPDERLVPKSQRGGRNLRNAAYDRNPLLTFLAENGLFHDKDQPGSLKSEFSPDKQMMVMGYGPVFRKGGKRLDELVDHAVQAGYLPQGGDERQLYSLIQRAVAGEKILPMYAQGVAEDDSERRMMAQRELEQEQAMTAQDAPEEVSQAEADVAALDDATFFILDENIPLTGPSNTSTENAMRVLGFSEQEIKDAVAQESAGAGQTSQGSQKPDEAVTGSTQGDSGSGSSEAGTPQQAQFGNTTAERISRQVGMFDAELKAEFDAIHDRDERRHQAQRDRVKLVQQRHDADTSAWDQSEFADRIRAVLKSLADAGEAGSNIRTAIQAGFFMDGKQGKLDEEKVAFREGIARKELAKILAGDNRPKANWVKVTPESLSESEPDIAKLPIEIVQAAVNRLNELGPKLAELGFAHQYEVDPRAPQDARDLADQMRAINSAMLLLAPIRERIARGYKNAKQSKLDRLEDYATEAIGINTRDYPGVSTVPTSVLSTHVEEAPTEANALKMGLGDFTQQAQKLIDMPAGSWVLLDGRRASYENGQFNVAFSWGNGKWSAGDTSTTPKDAYQSSLKTWEQRGNKQESFKPADKSAFLSGTQGPDLLTAPTQDDVLDQQDRKDNAGSLDDKAQIDKEAEHQTLTQQSAPEQRKDSTTDMFGLEKAEATIAAKKKGGTVSEGPSLFDEPAEPATPDPVAPVQAEREKLEAQRPSNEAGASQEETQAIGQALTDASKPEDGWEPHHLFDAPAKKDIVRLHEKVRVYQAQHGWMTIAEAKERIAEWKDHAEGQYDDAAKRSINSQKVVLSLFDLTGKWSEPWEKAGYNVFRFDFQNSTENDKTITARNERSGVNGGYNEDGDYDAENNVNPNDINSFSTEFFADFFGDFDGLDVHAILAGTPCTEFASSGARHFAAKDADGRTHSAVELVHQTLRTIEHFKPAIWAIENPVGRIEKLGGLPPWRLSFDPNQLGDPYTKKTLLWGRFNADLPIAPVEATEGSKMHSQYGGKSQATKNARSATPEGFSYGFFMANNAIDHPEMAISGKYDRLDRKLIDAAVKAGVTAAQISEAVDDHYYQDLDDQAGNAALQKLIDAAKAPAAPAEPEGDTGKDIPAKYFRIKVDHQIWIDDENKFEISKIPAKAALKSLNEDIDNYEKLLECMKG